MEHIAIKLRCYPNRTQLQALPQWFGSCRFVFNRALYTRIVDYENWVRLGKPEKYPWINFYALSSLLQTWKEEYPWLQEVSAQTLQQTLKHLDSAFTNWFKGRAKYPRFRKKSYSGSVHLTNQQLPEYNLEVVGKVLRLKLPKGLGVLKAKLHRPLPNGRLLKTVISRNSSGEYHTSLMYEVEDGYSLRQTPHEIKPRCGVDLGVVKPLTVAYVSNDSTQKFKVLGIEVKAQLEKVEKRRKRYQKSYARKLLSKKSRQAKVKPNKKTGEVQRVSTKNLDKARLKVAKIYQYEANIRRDFAEKTSNTLASRFEVIKFEDLKVSSMTKSAKGTLDEPGTNVAAKSGLNRELLRLGLSQVVSLTQYKARLYGGEVKFVNPQFTSQRCSCCGNINKENRKSQAVFKCVECGFKLNADHNAAINILTRKTLAA